MDKVENIANEEPVNMTDLELESVQEKEPLDTAYSNKDKPKNEDTIVDTASTNKEFTIKGQSKSNAKIKPCSSPTYVTDNKKLRITKIEANERFTIFSMEFYNVSGDTIIVYEPNHPKAFYLDTKKDKIPLVDVTNIMVNDFLVMSSNIKSFKLYFDLLPEGVEIVNMEIEIGSQEDKKWRFRNIDLSCPEY